MGLKHERLLGLLRTRMILDGFTPLAVDSSSPVINVGEFQCPCVIGKHRPDIIAVSTRSLAIGEAKTTSDCRTKRSKQQVIDFSEAVHSSQGTIGRFYLAVEQGGSVLLNSEIQKARSLIGDSLIVMCVEEKLLANAL